MTAANEQPFRPDQYHQDASILFYVTGILGVVIFLPNTVASALLGFPVSERFGLDPADLGYIQAIGGAVRLATSALFAALSSLEIVAARWLGRSLKKGAILGIVARCLDSF